MDEPKIILLDLTDCKGYELHERIKAAFDFPDYYGENWSAFWDLIDGTRDNTIVEIKGLSTLPHEFDKHIEKMLEILERNKEELKKMKERRPDFDCRFDYRIVNEE
ncbi:barstar family protein [Bacteroides sp. OttesenSCG-928-J23]|nr:barstar family protein [Bacteroides sp. OttesenSCG-928-J23]